jgi:hypothetical protein
MTEKQGVAVMTEEVMSKEPLQEMPREIDLHRLNNLHKVKIQTNNKVNKEIVLSNSRPDLNR